MQNFMLKKRKRILSVLRALLHELVCHPNQILAYLYANQLLFNSKEKMTSVDSSSGQCNHIIAFLFGKIEIEKSEKPQFNWPQITCMAQSGETLAFYEPATHGKIFICDMKIL